METHAPDQTETAQLPPFSDETVETLYATGYELYRNGKYGDAKDFFKLLAITDPSSRRYWMGQGACHQMLKEYDNAVNCYSVAAVLDPDDPYVHWHAADCFFQKGERQKAIDTLSSALIVAKHKEEHLVLVPKLELLHTIWSRDTLRKAT